MRRLSVLPALALIALASPAATATAAGPRALPQPPSVLPGAASASTARDDGPGWIVAGRDGRATAAIAARFDGRPLVGGAYLVQRARAHGLAAALRRAGRFVYAEPNVRTSPAVSADPLDAMPAWGGHSWRDHVVEPNLVAPTVTARSPKLFLIDSQMDVHHPEFASSNLRSEGHGVARIEHGTATIAVAGAPANGRGITGIWPDMRAINLPFDLTCSGAVSNVLRAIRQGAATINMSYGSPRLCYSEYIALQLATGRGVVLVAAAGNELAEGNPLEFPASLPHVLTVAATGPDDEPTYFSNANAAIDLSAPGENITTAIPIALDTHDGVRDGYTAMSGTSFSAPMVSAAATWVRQARPRLTAYQIAQVIRYGARDVGRRGWEPSTGYGVLDVGRSLALRAPPNDPDEPNDGIPWINGTFFKGVDPPIFSPRSRARSFGATLDVYEDPEDVYRVVMAPRSRVGISLKPSPRSGNVNLVVFSHRARSTACATLRRCANRLGRSLHGGSHRDTVTVRNHSRHAQTLYVEAYINSRERTLNARYELRVLRLRG